MRERSRPLDIHVPRYHATQLRHSATNSVRIMTRRLDCIAEGCTASIEGETDEEILEQAAAHASNAHPDLDLNDEFVAELRSHIVTV